MLDNQLLLWRSIVYRSLFMGVMISLLISPIALADPPANPKEQSVPVQLTLIQENMVLMEARLSQIMADIQSSVDVGNGKLDDLQASADTLQLTADNIYGVVTEVNIEMTTTLCFDAGAKFEGSVGIHDEVGVGWPNVLSAEAVLEGSGAIGGELAVSSQLCIDVPLYSVESYDQLFTGDGGEFDALIRTLALPSQTIVPVIANIYTELMPTPDEALEAMNNFTVASAGYDIYSGNIGTPNPIALLRPDLLLEPVIPHAAVEFILQVPDALTKALLDPCGTLEATPIGNALKDRDDVKFLCGAHADALQVIGDAVTWIYNAIEDVLKFFGL